MDLLHWNINKMQIQVENVKNRAFRTPLIPLFISSFIDSLNPSEATVLNPHRKNAVFVSVAMSKSESIFANTRKNTKPQNMALKTIIDV